MSFEEKLDYALLSTNASLEHLEGVQERIDDALKELNEIKGNLEELKSDYEYIKDVFK